MRALFNLFGVIKSRTDTLAPCNCLTVCYGEGGNYDSAALLFPRVLAQLIGSLNRELLNSKIRLF